MNKLSINTSTSLLRKQQPLRLHKKVLALYSSAIVALTSCEPGVSRIFVLPSEDLITSHGKLETCTLAYSTLPGREGRQPWFEAPEPTERTYIEDLKPLPTLFRHKLPSDQVLEMLLSLRSELIEVHNSFVQKEWRGFSITRLEIDEGKVKDRWELALYTPMVNFIQKLRQYYPDIHSCALDSQSYDEIFGFTRKIISDFAQHHGFVIELTVLEACSQGSIVPHFGFTVDQKVQTLAVDAGDDVSFDESVFDGGLRAAVEPIHTGVQHAKSLLRRVQQDIRHLDLSVPETWDLSVHRGTTEGISKAFVRGGSMTIQNIDNIESLHSSIAHEYGHLLHMKLRDTIDEKKRRTGNNSPHAEIEGITFTDKAVYEAVGELFELWSVVQSDGNSLNFVSQINRIFKAILEDYKMPRELILQQIEADTGVSLVQMREAMLKSPEQFALVVDRAYNTKESQEELILNLIHRLDRLVGVFLEKDWDPEIVQESSVGKGQVSRKCE